MTGQPCLASPRILPRLLAWYAFIHGEQPSAVTCQSKSYILHYCKSHTYKTTAGMSDEKVSQGCGGFAKRFSPKTEPETSLKLRAGVALPHVTLPTTEV